MNWSRLFAKLMKRETLRDLTSAKTSKRRRLLLEPLEDRLAPATLPVPDVVADATRLAGGFNPILHRSPVDPNKLFAVYTTGTTLDYLYSTNNGATWSGNRIFDTIPGNLIPTVAFDKRTPAAIQDPFPEITNPGFTWDRSQNLFIVSLHHDAGYTGGELILTKLNFSGGAPTTTILSKVLGDWYNAEPILTPTIGLDSNIATYTDPQTGDTGPIDTMSEKALYVAWASNTTGSVLPNGIRIIGTQDLEATTANTMRFTTPVWLSEGLDPDFAALQIRRFIGPSVGGQVNPQLLFSQQGVGPGGTSGAELVAAWATTAAQTLSLPGEIPDIVAAGSIRSDTSSPDGGVLTQSAAVGWTVSDAPLAAINDSIIRINPATGARLPDQEVTTTYTLNVNIPLGEFTTLTDLDLGISLDHLHLDQLEAVLEAPDGTRVQLWNNRVDTRVINGTLQLPFTIGGGLLDTRGMGITILFPQNPPGNPGEIIRNTPVIFDMESWQLIGNALSFPVTSGNVLYSGRYRPEDTAYQDLSPAGTTDGFATNFYGMTREQINGTWRLHITDWFNNAPAPPTPNPSTMRFWSLNFSSAIDNTNEFGTPLGNDVTVVSTGLGGTVSGPQLGTGVTFSMAQDTSLGSFSPNAGRIYIAHPLNTDVAISASNNVGGTWSILNAKVNNDFFDDQTNTTGLRRQYQPTVAVDPVTGVVVMTWYDTRWDPTQTRAATYVAASIDGGATWSEQIWINPTKTALDSITLETVELEPIPSNLPVAGANGWGARQGLSVYDGKMIPIFSGNFNAGGSNLLTADVRVAAGPRIVESNMGPITQQGNALVEAWDPNDGANQAIGSIPYNHTFAADGTREFTAFEVTFDRPIDPASFDLSDITVLYRSPTQSTGSPGTPVAVGNIIALDDRGLFGWRGTGGTGVGGLATRFLVVLATPQSLTGTYSYAIGPDIRDRVRSDALVVTPGAAQTFTSSQVPRSFGGQNPNLPNTITSSVDVTPVGGGLIADVNVTLNITHTFTADVRVTLIAPSGTRVLLIDKRGGGGDNFGGTTLDDQAATTIGAGSAPFIGSFRPEQPLAQLIGQAMGGTWTLEVSDLATALDDGVLNSWSLRITSGTASTAPKLGNQMDQNNNGVANEFQLDRYAIPAPTSDIPFQLPYDAETLPVIIPGPYVTGTALTGTALPGQTPGVQVIPATASQVGQQFGATGFPASITSSITVPFPLADVDRVIADLNVTMTVTHPFIGDMIITLIAPDGTRILLSENAGGNGNNLILTTFDDQATTFVTGGAAPLFGSFRPEGDNLAQGRPAGTNTLSLLNGKNMGGVWRLEIVDTDTVNDGGQLVSWSLEVLPENLARNRTINSIDLQFDRDIRISSFTVGNIHRITGPLGAVTGTFTVTPLNPTGTFARLFRVGFPTQQLSGDYTVELGGDPTANGRYITSTDGDELDTNLNAGLYVLRGADPTNFATENITVTHPGNVVLPAAKVTEIPLNVVEQFDIRDLTVAIGINIPRTSDIELILAAPDGTTVKLATRVGANLVPSANFTNTIFDDAAIDPLSGGPNPIQFGAPPFTGTYNPQTPLQVFRGKNSFGVWRLIVVNNSTSQDGLLVGASPVAPAFELRFVKTVLGTGLGEDNADKVSTGFRIFTMDPTNPLSGDNWTAIGPTVGFDTNPNHSPNKTLFSSDITTVAVDPSDPSGNTVYVGGAYSGIWKTTNFLTADPTGPTWTSLVDGGPGGSLTIGQITVIPVNNDPLRSIILAGTGDLNTNQPGVGFLRSQDGGLTWQVIDSTINFNPNTGAILPFTNDSDPNTPDRDRVFVNARINKIVYDPNSNPSSPTLIYAAVSGNNNAGLYQSTDAGKSWTNIRPGEATDIALSYGSKGSDGLLQIFYAAFAADGVYLTQNRGASFTLMAGGEGRPQIRDFGTNFEIFVAGPGDTPNGGKGRISLATPAFANEPLLDFFYQSWCYALVSTGPGEFDDLYVTKDFGRNWTRVKMGDFTHIPATNPPPPSVPTGLFTRPAVTGASNDENLPTTSPTGVGAVGTGTANRALGITVDPFDPRIVYIAADRMIKVDLTKLEDPQALVGLNNNNNDGGTIQANSLGNVAVAGTWGVHDTITEQFQPGSYLNLSRDPGNPFIALTTLRTSGVVFNPLVTPRGFQNRGWDATWNRYDYGTFATTIGGNGTVFDFTDEVEYLDDPGVRNTHRYQVVAVPDLLTGKTRLLVAASNGVYTGVDRGDTVMLGDIGTANITSGDRNGNLAIARLRQGSLQPTATAASIADALFYASTALYGFPSSDPEILANGNLDWHTFDTPPFGTPLRVEDDEGGGQGVEAVVTGTGRVWRYRSPETVQLADGPGVNTDFVQLLIPNSNVFSGRTTGLLGGSTPGSSQFDRWASDIQPILTDPIDVKPLSPDWRDGFGARPSINPHDTRIITTNGQRITNRSVGAAISDSQGRVYRTADEGLNWFPITPTAGTTTGAAWNNTHARAFAFGAPIPPTPTPTDPNPDPLSAPLHDFIYAGNLGGQIFVTFNGGGRWFNISAGLDNRPIQAIATNPARGTFEAYAVTSSGVFYMADSRSATATWVNITSNLFGLTHTLLRDSTQVQEILRPYDPTTGVGGLTSIVADWRFRLPENPSNPLGRDHPILYVGGDGGVFRARQIRTGVGPGNTVWQYFPNVAQDGAVREGGLMPHVLITDLALVSGAFSSLTQSTDQTLNVLLATTNGRSAYAIRLPITGITGAVAGGPRVESVLPADPAAATMDSVIVTFTPDSVVEPSTFRVGTTPPDIVFTDTDGVNIPILNIVDVTPIPVAGQPNRHHVYQVFFAPQTKNGAYKMVIGPNITDPGGNPMNQTQDGVNGQTPSDQYIARFFRNTTAAGPYVPVLLTRLVSTGEIIAEYSDGVNGFERVLWDIMPNNATWVDVFAADVTGDERSDYFGRIRETGEWWVAVSVGNAFTVSRWTSWDPSVNWVDVKIGDFDGDGRTDIVGRNAANGVLLVGLSTGSGFVSTVWGNFNIIPALAGQAYLNTVVADFSGDGLADIAVRFGNNQWWVGVSDTLQFNLANWGVTWPAGTYVDVNFGDFNNDNRRDIAGRLASTGEWRVNLSTGTAFTQSVWTTWTASTTWVDVLFGDYDGDGDTDIAGRAATTGVWSVSRSNGATAFAPQAVWATWAANPGGQPWASVVVGDFSGDGRADIAGRVVNSGEWWVAVSTGAAFTTTKWTQWDPNVPWADVRVGTYDTDAGVQRADILGRNPFNGRTIVARSLGNAFDSTAPTPADPTGITGPVLMPSTITWVDPFTQDFNGDGKDDYAARILQSGQWFVSLNNGGGGYRFTPWATWSPDVQWLDVLAADLTGTPVGERPKADIAGRVSTSGQWWVSVSNGSSFDTANWTPGTGGATVNDRPWAVIPWQTVRVGDFNGDGRFDVAGREPGAGTWWVAVSDGTKFITSSWVTWSTAVNWVNVLVADFDNDGRDDIAGRVQQSGQWWVNVSNGTSFTAQYWQLAWAPGANWVDVNVGDYDGDGRYDIAGRDAGTGQWWVNLSRDVAGTNRFVSSRWETWAPGAADVWVNVLVANSDTDFNGDGLSDIYGRHFASGAQYVGLSNGIDRFTTTLWDLFLPGAVTNNARVGRRS